MDDDLEPLPDAGLAIQPPPSLIDRAVDLFHAGGPVVAILTAMSVVALTIILLKLWQFRTVRLGDRRTAREALWLYRTGRAGEALTMARGSPSPAAQALARALSGQRRHLPEARVREEVARYGEEVLAILRSEVVRGSRTISDSVATAKAGVQLRQRRTPSSGPGIPAAGGRSACGEAACGYAAALGQR